MDPFRSNSDRPTGLNFSARGEDIDSRESPGEAGKKDQSKNDQERDVPHLDALYRHAGTLNLSEEEAEDLIEETYRTVFEDSERKDYGKTELKKRLFSTLRNLYTKHDADRGVSSMGVNSGMASSYRNFLNETTLSMLNEFNESLFSNISSGDIERASRHVPEQSLSCVELADGENFSYEEISEILNCSKQSVKKLLHQGRNIMKKELVEEAMSQGDFPTD